MRLVAGLLALSISLHSLNAAAETTDRIPAEPARDAFSLAKTAPTGGGPDSSIGGSPSIVDSDLAIAANGDVYVAVQRGFSGDDRFIEVLRSTDGGNSFQTWGPPIGQGDGFLQDSVRMILAEGVSDRIFVQYRNWAAGVNTNNVAWAALGAPPASWNVRQPFQVSGITFDWGDIDSDVQSYSDYYLYAVATARDGDAPDIWFARSTDQGDTWEAPYRIGELSGNDNLKYTDPYVSYGFGGFVHVGWLFSENLQDTFDDQILYRRASGSASAGIGSWGSIVPITGDADGLDSHILDIEASSTGAEVMIALTPQYNDFDGFLRLSTNAGATWPASQQIDSGFRLGLDLEFQPATGVFLVGGASFHEFAPTAYYDRAWRQVTPSVPMVLGPVEILSDQSQAGVASMTAHLALSPTRTPPVAMLWNVYSPSFGVAFDAEWRGAAGFPTPQWEFPLSAGAHTPPAIVELDGDPQLEVVFAESNGLVHVLDHLGDEQDGWPRPTGVIPPRGAVAVGDLTGDGTLALVVGDTAGRVHAFAPDGTILPGYPVDTGIGAPARVAIGALGGPYPRNVVVTAGDRLLVYNYRGVELSPYWQFTSDFEAPAAIGDIDGDGVGEIVTAKGSFVHVHRLGSAGNVMFRNFFGEDFREAPSLGDLDLDGDLEIALPSESGKVFVIHHDGTDMAGSWPYVDPSGTPASAVAIVDFLGNTEPELAFASEDATLHAVFADGVEQFAYPKPTTPGDLLVAGPIVDRLDRTSPNLTVATSGGDAWTYQNTGGSVADWPWALPGAVEVAAASGDIDLDGYAEYVFVASGAVVAVDVNNAPHTTPFRRWPMYGYDPARTQCLDCDEDVATSVEGVSTSSVRFDAPTPNPSGGAVHFSFSLPDRAVVAFEVFDVRGRRVRLVQRSELAAGTHRISFDGRDGRGRVLAAGQYFARLTARGPGIDVERSRKFSVLR